MARRFAAGAALVFLAAVVPGVGAAAAPAGSAGRVSDAAAIQQLQDRSLASLNVPAAVMNAAVRAAGRMAPDSAGTGRAGAVSLDSGLMPAGDFTRDGVRDVL